MSWCCLSLGQPFNGLAKFARGCGSQGITAESLPWGNPEESDEIGAQEQGECWSAVLRSARRLYILPIDSRILDIRKAPSLKYSRSQPTISRFENAPSQEGIVCAWPGRLGRSTSPSAQRRWHTFAHPLGLRRYR
jgi:hypothetical protein